MLENKSLVTKINNLAQKQIPFLFIIDFKGVQAQVHELNQLPPNIRFSCPGFPDRVMKQQRKDLKLTKSPMSFSAYKYKFDRVMKELQHGNSYLINLTQPTPIQLNWSLEEVYENSRAPYKLLVKDQFVVFSPEIFIRIKGQRIETFPMKGTIDAQIPNAAEKLLADPKETAEHHTIVDLMRNDLSRFANQVKVERFRFLDEIQTHEKKILQASSEISGQLPANFRDSLGELISSLLPAGSISGAPKAKTLDILESVEDYERKYYTGIFGVFDGQNLDSAVMIRFIEATQAGLVFKSGGGITHLSEAKKEYQELIDKVYVPIA